MHKGFKCLDISTGRIYIPRDVVFDEAFFPFATLHPNSGALLRSEIVLLPSSLRNPGDDDCYDSNITNPTNVPGDPSVLQKENGVPSAGGIPGVQLFLDASLLPVIEDLGNRSQADSIDSPSTPLEADLDTMLRTGAMQSAPAHEGESPSGSPPASAPHVPDARNESASTSPSPSATTGPTNQRVPVSTVPPTGAPLVSSVPDSEPQRHQTRLQSGTVKPKRMYDGMIRYSFFSATGEPNSVREALANSKWRQAMEAEFDALRKNQTW
jgi:hypothetical protein